LFGALAFARYRWQGRRLFQKIVILPILFPQAVLGLALLLWFTAIGITPTWQAAVFAHLVWIAPITTLVIAIQVYAFDPAVEEAAFDLGASRWQVLREVTLPILAPGIFSGFLFAFLLSWANFPLSMFSTGAHQAIPEWITAKVQAGLYAAGAGGRHVDDAGGGSDPRPRRRAGPLVEPASGAAARRLSNRWRSGAAAPFRSRYRPVPRHCDAGLCGSLVRALSPVVPIG
jgi:hypothetical protein